ncbi:hypothetical protein R3W88_024666 [Solanum pinnatisectum]|uniref:Uncharacterized protein n=1 Tax=Solanum pinnatisectum TaxID=50273 RepID=A0AAV9M0U3_9SOLN|nr:hypothetical protein R3W88_024666 [Solanum pinnatisectum]
MAAVPSAAKQSQTAATAATKGLTPEEVLMLPIVPCKRTAEELDQSQLGGGFRSYGYDRQGGGDTDREIAPSRADETDDWGAAKKNRLVMVLKEGGREVKGEVFFSIPSLKLMNVIIGQRIKLLYPLMVEDLIGEGVLGQTVVSPI